jgi:hypothetical protein
LLFLGVSIDSIAAENLSNPNAAVESNIFSVRFSPFIKSVEGARNVPD